MKVRYKKTWEKNLTLSFLTVSDLSEATDVTPINSARSSQREPLPDFGGHSPIRNQYQSDNEKHDDRPHGKLGTVWVVKVWWF